MPDWLHAGKAGGTIALLGVAVSVFVFATWVGAESVRYLAGDRLAPNFCPDGLADARVLVSSWVWAVAASTVLAAAAAHRGRWAAAAWWGRSFILIYAVSFATGFGVLLTDAMPRASFWLVPSIGASCAALWLAFAFARWSKREQ